MPATIVCDSVSCENLIVLMYGQLTRKSPQPLSWLAAVQFSSLFAHVRNWCGTTPYAQNMRAITYTSAAMASPPPRARPEGGRGPGRGGGTGDGGWGGGRGTGAPGGGIGCPPCPRAGRSPPGPAAPAPGSALRPRLRGAPEDPVLGHAGARQL